LIKLFALDVDGTLTDGGVYMNGTGGEWKRFSIQDGLGIVTLMHSGVKVVFISGRYSAATQQRADDLKISKCINGTKNKLEELKNLSAEWDIAREEIAYAGDDLPDIECIKWAGLGMAVANACKDVKTAASWTSSSFGGLGAVRECAEKILEMNGMNK
jgi:3-deoxy-D-manno-octulosonate 8-phosphate phosphatase (KDO 8-P phosphatase)